MTPADYPAVACATGMRHPALLALRGIVKHAIPCGAFLDCTNEATTFTPNAALGDVQCCQRCYDRMASIRGVRPTWHTPGDDGRCEHCDVGVEWTGSDDPNEWGAYADSTGSLFCSDDTND